MSDEQKDIQTTETKNETSSYRSIFKATSLFGGVQVYQILISVIKSKVISVLLGPVGMGISGLLTSATSFIQGFSSLGLSQSAVRDVSQSYASGNQERVNVVASVIHKLVWFTGLLGLILVVALSPVLSKTSFGNNEYIIAFVFLSITLLLDQLCAGQKVLLQGTRRLKDLAKASAIGATLGLLACIPIYYLWGVKGIVPTLIVTSSINLFLSWHFSKRVHYTRVDLDFRSVLSEGESMLKMGFAMSISSVLVYGCSYVLRSFISREGGVGEVGLFSAGFSIMVNYAGLVFSAMSTDYYPRLSAVNNDNAKCKQTINQQAEIGLLILAPLLVICITFSKLIICILYTEEFLPITGYLIWASMGMMFKLASWSISFVFIAKSESKIYMMNEIISNIYILALNLIGYKLYGIIGLGLSFLAGYVFYTIQVYLISHKKYNFSFSKNFVCLFAIQMVLIGLSIILMLFTAGVVHYLLGGLVVLLSGIYSVVRLDKLVGLRNVVRL